MRPLRVPFRPPKASAAHRTAALALYKALLTGCQRCGFTELQALQFSNVIKNRFREHHEAIGRTRLTVLFAAGYQAVDHFDAIADGEQSSKDYMLDLLSRTPGRSRHPPFRDVQKIKRGKAIRAGPPPKLPPRPKLSLDDRPLPLEKLTGRRHIPRLVNAGGIPMLRFTKPQPPMLSPYFAARIVQRERRHQLKDKLNEDVAVGECEEEWDELMAQAAEDNGVVMAKKEEQEQSWAHELRNAFRHVEQLIKLEQRKCEEMAIKMQGIIDKETALAQQEREDMQRDLTTLPHTMLDG